jgi:hypothetical protein
MTVKANDKQIGLVIEQKADDGVHGVAFQQTSLQLHALAQSGITGLGMQTGTVRLLVFDESPLEREESVAAAN